jgi:mannose-1-phosphate guanylyltransferase
MIKKNKKSNFFAVILAGGKGERFWPKSRKNFPKQFVNLFGTDSLLHQTSKRIGKIINTKDQYFVIPGNLVRLLKKQIPIKDKNIIIEPMGRNTAPAIALAAIYLEKISPDTIMIVLPADHLIEQEAKFFDCVKFAYDIAQKGYYVTFGIPPTSPDTGYGYIEVGDKYKVKNGITSFTGKRFVEKPNLELARKYLEARRYFWNSGMFVWKVSTILDGLRKCLPEFYDALKYFQQFIGTKREQTLLKKIYEKAPATSIDYAVLEKVKNIVVVKANFVWDDVGSWQALERHFDKDEFKNVKIGKCFVKDTDNSIVFGDKGLIALMGVKDVIVVQTKDATLVLSKEKAAQLKELIKVIGQDKTGKKYL